MSTDSELLILGGGCAGLSLARDLAHHGARCPSTRIIERRDVYDNDRTWCFWHEDALLSHLVEHQWPQVMLRARDAATQLDCSRHPYQMISGRRFYADALAAIHGAPQIQLEKNVQILSEPRYCDGVWEIDTDAGIHRAHKLVDTRAGKMPDSRHDAPILWQSFHGMDITCDAPMFDPAMATLMDFADAASDCIVFTYVLPKSPTCALIEVTVFGATPVTEAELAPQLQRQVQSRVGAHGFVVERVEYGVLPMGLPCRRSSSHANHVRVGLMHGGARASTGYAFQRIQRWAKQCALQIIDGVALTGHAPDPVLTRLMDRLFLSLLRNQPMIAPKLFMSLFTRCEPSALVRFLSDRASLRDDLSVITALPVLPFFHQLILPLSGQRSRQFIGRLLHRRQHRS